MASGSPDPARPSKAALAASPRVRGRRLLVAAATAFLERQGLPVSDDLRQRLIDEVGAAGTAAIATLAARLDEVRGWDYRPADPLAQRMHELLADMVLHEDSSVGGIEHLQAVATAPVLLFGNHLSYADANLVALMLQRAGQQAVVDRLTVVAGPKVFADRARRFSSLCFGTIRVPQSGDVASGEAVMPAREVARASRQAIDAAWQRLSAGDAVLVFGEGTRSRSGAMQPMLPAVARYLEAPGAWVVPFALTGAEALMPVGGAPLTAATITLRFGQPLSATALLAGAVDRRYAMDAIGLAIAERLPPAYRGAYADPVPGSPAVRLLKGARASVRD